MAREDVKKIIDSIEAGDNVGASDAFATAMVDKQKDAIEGKRLDVQLVHFRVQASAAQKLSGAGLLEQVKDFWAGSHTW